MTIPSIGDERDLFFLELDEGTSSQPPSRKEEIDNEISQLGQRVLQNFPTHLNSFFQPDDFVSVSPPKSNEDADAPNTPNAPNVANDLEQQRLDDQLEDLGKAIRNLEHHYKKWSQDFNQQYEGLIANFLECFEYLSVNKGNILDIAQQLASRQFQSIDSSLSRVDILYKWMNCVNPLINNAIKFSILYNLKKQLTAYQGSYEDLKDKLPKAISYSEKMNEIQKLIENFNQQLEKDSTEMLEYSLNKGLKFLKKGSKVSLEVFLKVASKTAQKLSTCFYSIFKDAKDFVNVKKAISHQNEWSYHLESRILVNVYPNEPTPAQLALKNEHHVAQGQLIQESKNFLNTLDGYATIEEVKTYLKTVDITLPLSFTIEEFKKQFHRNPRFTRQLVQCFYYSVGQKRAYMNSDQIVSLLISKEDEHNSKVDLKLPSINSHIDKCQNMSLPEIKTYFANLHIYIDTIILPNEGDNIPSPPTTIEEWEECIQTEEFRRALAGQLVDFQETLAQLSVQAARQNLISKLDVEGRFLFFRKIEYVIKIVSAIAQLFFYFTPVSLLALSTSVDFCVSDISKSGIPGAGLFYVLYPLYPGVHFRLESILMLLAEHLFAIKYKPNTYSVESYMLLIQIRMVETMLLAHFVHSCLQQALLWINVQLIENCILQIIKPNLSKDERPIEDERAIQIKNTYDKSFVNGKKQIKALEKKLRKLKIKDAKLILQTQSQDSNGKKIDPIEELVQAWQEADFECFPSQTKDFFEDHYGIKLDEIKSEKVTPKQLKKELKDFFCTSENQFVDIYRSNRFAYLQGG